MNLLIKIISMHNFNKQISSKDSFMRGKAPSCIIYYTVNNQEPIKKREDFAVSLRASKKREILQSKRQSHHYRLSGTLGTLLTNPEEDNLQFEDVMDVIKMLQQS